MRLFRRVAGIIAALVGLVFVIVGTTLVVSQHWAPATGTVQSCTSQIVHTTGGTGHLRHVCDVTWQDAAGQHVGSVDFGGVSLASGQTARLRVHGNMAVLPTPAWEGFTAVGLGLMMFVLGLFVTVRSWRRG